MRQAHFRHLSLDEHEKLQIFLNYSLHGDHDLTDSDILSATTLFKSTVNLSTSSKSFPAMQTTLSKSIKKSVFDTLIKLNTPAKKTATPKPLIITDPQAPAFTDSPLSASSPLSLKPDLINEGNELAQLSDEDEEPKFSELKDLRDQIKLLELKKLKLAQCADEKISFLMLLTVRLNETILLQGEDVVSAGAFIKQLLNELTVQAD